MRKFITDFLGKRGYKVNVKALELIDLCDSWYRTELIDGFHERYTVNGEKYEMERTGFAKKACEDDANLCEVVDIILEDKHTSDYINKVLNRERFQKNLREQLELIAAEGTVAAYVRVVGADILETQELRGGQIELVYVKPNGIFPL